MNALDILNQVREAGGCIGVDGARLVLTGSQPLSPDLQQAVRDHKAELLVALGVPLDCAVASILGELRPNLPRALQQLGDAKLLVLVNCSLVAAWEKSVLQVMR